MKFTEDFKFPGTNCSVEFSYQSYNAWVRSVLPMAEDLPIVHQRQARQTGNHVPVGDYLFYVRELPYKSLQARYWLDFKGRLQRSKLEVYQGRRKAWCKFTGKVGVPILADSSLSPWMSLTPNEVITQRGQLRYMRGNAAVAGLGLGWFARRCLERTKVDRLTVVDKCEDVLRVFGEPLQQEFGDRLELVCEDAYKFDWHQFDSVCWDIWQGYDDKAYDDEFKRLRLSLLGMGKNCVGWGLGSPAYSY